MDLLEENVELLDKITEQKGETVAALRTTSLTWTAIGDIRLESDVVKAEEAYRAGLEIDKRLVRRTEDEWLGQQRDLASNYRKIAQVNKALDNISAARAAAEQARVIRQELLDKCKDCCAQDRRRLRDVDAKIDTI